MTDPTTQEIEAAARALCEYEANRTGAAECPEKAPPCLACSGAATAALAAAAAVRNDDLARKLAELEDFIGKGTMREMVLRNQTISARAALLESRAREAEASRDDLTRQLAEEREGLLNSLRSRGLAIEGDPFPAWMQTVASLDAVRNERDDLARKLAELQRDVDKAGQIILAHGATQRDLTRKLAEAEASREEWRNAAAEAIGRVYSEDQWNRLQTDLTASERKLAEAVDELKICQAHNRMMEGSHAAHRDKLELELAEAAELLTRARKLTRNTFPGGGTITSEIDAFIQKQEAGK
jgi:hypothetical protein